jgi:hypothetical protein
LGLLSEIESTWHIKEHVLIPVYDTDDRYEDSKDDEESFFSTEFENNE